MANSQPVKGKPWFSTPGKPGDRTLEQQLMGLDPLFAEVAGKTVLDVGCAEGLISIECAKRGANAVTGMEVRMTAVEAARRRNVDGVTDFYHADAETFTKEIWKTPGWDIVLMLAVLHKLRDPSAACRRLAAAAKDLVVIRLPPKYAPDVVDERSGMRVHDINATMAETGFFCEVSNYNGPFGEWVGYYRRAR